MLWGTNTKRPPFELQGQTSEEIMKRVLSAACAAILAVSVPAGAAPTVFPQPSAAPSNVVEAQFTIEDYRANRRAGRHWRGRYGPEGGPIVRHGGSRYWKGHR